MAYDVFAASYAESSPSAAASLGSSGDDRLPRAGRDTADPMDFDAATANTLITATEP